jgi:hypothetical protein
MIYSVSGPGSFQIKMAYNPMIIVVFTYGVNPIVYVDVYFNGNFYKTITATSSDGSFFGYNFWNIDIRDAAQEFLSSGRPLPAPLAPTTAQQVNAGVAMCTVKVRGTTVTGGFTVPDTPIPVQATVDNAASAGGGTPPTGSPSWVVFNGALQYEENPDPLVSLAANNVGVVQAGYKFYNLFKNTKLTVTAGDYLSLPIYIPNDGMTPPGSGALVATENYYLAMEDDAGNQYYPVNAGAPPTYATYMAYASNSIYYLPAGPKNFAGLGVSFGAPPNWATIKKYRMILTTGSLALGGNTRWRSPWITVKRSACATRIRFVNWYGAYDLLVFCEQQEEFVVTADGWEQYNLGDFNTLNRERSGRMRFNVRSNELFTINGYFVEADMWLVKQLLSTPISFIERPGKVAGVDDYLQPVVIGAVTILTKKIDERYIYYVTIQAQPANERINIRN